MTVRQCCPLSIKGGAKKDFIARKSGKLSLVEGIQKETCGKRTALPSRGGSSSSESKGGRRVWVKNKRKVPVTGLGEKSVSITGAVRGRVANGGSRELK